MGVRANVAGWVVLVAIGAWDVAGCASATRSPAIVTDAFGDLSAETGGPDLLPEDAVDEPGPSDAGTDPGFVPVDPMLALHLQSLLDEYLQFSG